MTTENDVNENVPDGAKISEKNSLKPEQVDQNPRRSLCLFKRSSGNILNLRYSSDVLEKHYQECSLSYATYRYKFSSLYCILVAIVWLVYAIIRNEDYVSYVVGFVIAVLVFGILFGLAYAEDFFRKTHVWFYIALGCCMSIFSLVSFAVTKESAPRSFSLIFNTYLCIQTILLLYTMVPVRLWQAIVIGAAMSVLFVLMAIGHFGVQSWRIVVILVLLQLVAHLVGLVHHLTSQARRRATFLKLGQSAELKLRIKKEQDTQKEMIQSLMPLDVAQEVMADMNEKKKGGSGGGSKRKDSEFSEAGDSRRRKKSSNASNGDPEGGRKKCKKKRRQSEREEEDSSDEEVMVNNNTNNKPRSSTAMMDAVDDELEMNSVASETIAQPSQVTFRKLYVKQMNNVSILFADIVGFTRMSSNKTAPHLVSLLNDLFGSFDKLCETNGCEKIATLGDCYYCVAGCPTETVDHAERCVEMGRSMCLAIQQFDVKHNEEVNMRVGVHTGNVTCGIVGTHRFKFDVWSHDVTLANEMESSGQAGRVHISEDTYNFVKDTYKVDPGIELKDIRELEVLTEYFDEETQSYAIKHVQNKKVITTYFVIERFDGKPVRLVDDAPEGGVALAIESADVPVVAETAIDPAPEDALQEPQQQQLQQQPLVPQSHSEHRKQEHDEAILKDEEIVQCLREEPSQIESFFKPPINYCTLLFENDNLERRYHRVGLRPHRRHNRQLTWANYRVTPLINGLTNWIHIAAVIVACFIGFAQPPTTSNYYSYQNRAVFYGLLALTVLVNLVFIVPLLLDFALLSRIPSRFSRFYRCFYQWHIRCLFSPLVLGLPLVLVLLHTDRCLLPPSLSSGTGHTGYRLALGLQLLLGLLNLTLFSLYSSWIKSATAAVVLSVAACLLAILRYRPLATTDCRFFAPFLQAFNSSQQSYMNMTNTSKIAGVTPLWLLSSSSDWMEVEVLVALGLSLVFIVFFNREMDISFRASFSCDHTARRARQTMAEERRQAEWLLENIIPKYVIEPVKKTKSYSQHMEQVGVIFATIANFDKFYDEQYKGGQEMLRVLNEVFADFENLLSRPKYADIEKIKTIGSCFMAASGLNPTRRSRQKGSAGEQKDQVENSRAANRHLYALMDFSMDLITTLNSFNEQLFNFAFELKIGYNIGDVTAGVIGTTKLLYDIWGDTVNVASRMYSTGSKGCVQVTQAVAEKLGERYEFKYRGEVEVKGKGKMNTYLLVDKKRAPQQ